MLEKVDAVNSVINNFIWGVPAMICIIGVGLYLSFRTRFLQIRKFPYAMKVTFGRMFKKKEAGDGALTPFQAVCTLWFENLGEWKKMDPVIDMDLHKAIHQVLLEHGWL